jgi:hypothetical protein
VEGVFDAGEHRRRERDGFAGGDIGRQQRRQGIVKLTGKPQKIFHWDSILALDDLLISHLRRRVDAQRLSAPHSVPLFFRDHR